MTQTMQTSAARFQTRAAKESDFTPGEHYSGASMGVVAPGRLAMEVLGKELHYGLLFAYLFRRFGFPNSEADPHKEIAKYLLTTPMPELFLEVSVKANTSTSLLFGYVMPSSMEAQLQAEHDEDLDQFHVNFLAWRKAKGYVLPRDVGEEYDYREDNRQFKKVLELYIADGGVHYQNLASGPVTGAVLEALRATLLDIKTPVGVRDRMFSAVDESCDDPFADEAEADGGRESEIASAYHASGYFIPDGYMADPEMFVAMTQKLVELGNGDLAAGVACYVGGPKVGGLIPRQ